MSILIRVIVPGGLLLLAGLQIASGSAETLPSWIVLLSEWAGIAPTLFFRMIVGLEIIAAGLIFCAPRLAGPTAILALGAICFVEIAELSAGGDTSGLTGQFEVHPIVPLLLAGIFCALIIFLHESKPSSQKRSRIVLVSGAVIAVAAVVAIVIPVADVSSEKNTPISNERPDVVEFSFNTLQGQSLSASVITNYLPDLTAMTLEGRHYIVLYNPMCGKCHDFFDKHFSTDSSASVIAVKVPPARGAYVLESDQPEHLNCPNCQFLELPAGPVWLTTPPSILTVEDGIITCAAERDCEQCIDSPPSH